MVEQAVIIGASATAGSLLLVFLLLNFVLLPQGHEEKQKEQLKSRLLKNVIITGGSSGIGRRHLHEVNGGDGRAQNTDHTLRRRLAAALRSVFV